MYCGLNKIDTLTRSRNCNIPCKDGETGGYADLLQSFERRGKDLDRTGGRGIGAGLSNTISRGKCPSLKIFSLGIFLFGMAFTANSAPLVIHPDNPRYFLDGTGEAVYLAGSHTWYILHEQGHEVDRQRVVDYLDWLKSIGHNYTRVWSNWFYLFNDKGLQQPWPYERTGPGLAKDGFLKFDLTKPNNDYFALLRFFLSESEKRGLYCSIMLFGSYNQFRSNFQTNTAWYPDNNINDETNLLRQNTDFFDLGSDVLTLQKAHIRHVVDELNDYDNFFWEIINEAQLPKSRNWQYHLIKYLKEYEQSKEKQHLVVMSGGHGEAGGALENSPADIISPDTSTVGDYKSGGPGDYSDKPVINDTDHLWGYSQHKDVEKYRKWVWKTFLRGNHPLFMEDYDSFSNNNKGRINKEFNPVRTALSETIKFSKRVIDLAAMVPESDYCSTKYCLVNREGEYLAYYPGEATEFAGWQNIVEHITNAIQSLSKPVARKVVIKLGAGSYLLEWLDARTGQAFNSEIQIAENKSKVLFVPKNIEDDAVVYIKSLRLGN